MKKILILLALIITGATLWFGLDYKNKSDISPNRIVDKANLYSFEVPSGWKIIKNEGSTEFGQLSNLSFETSDWKTREDNSGDICSRTYIDSGASFFIFAQKGTGIGVHSGEGGGTEVGVTEKKDVIVDEVEGLFHKYKNFCTVEGGSMDVHFVRDGKSYHIVMDYNPDKFTDAEEIFTHVVNSFKFKD